jgi:hypothetical protein
MRADLQRELQAVGPEAFTARDYGPGRVIHIVLFKLGPDAPTGAAEEVRQRFHALAQSVRDDGAPYIRSIESGAQRSGEGQEGAGYDLGFVVTFDSEGDRNYYVGAPIQPDPRWFDPAHAAFKEFVGPLVAGGAVLVYDIAPGED